MVDLDKNNELFSLLQIDIKFYKITLKIWKRKEINVVISVISVMVLNRTSEWFRGIFVNSLVFLARNNVVQCNSMILNKQTWKECMVVPIIWSGIKLWPFSSGSRPHKIGKRPNIKNPPLLLSKIITKFPEFLKN